MPKPKKTEPKPMERHYPDSLALCKAVLERTGPTCLLSFSGGKDAIASWLRLREAGFTRIVPFYYYLVPDLGFIEESLRYYEEYFATPIIRVPSPNLIRMLRNLIFAPPERAAILDAMAPLPRLGFADLEAHVRETSGVPPEAYVAIGTRTADSPIRLANIRQFGSLNPARRTFLPVYDMRIADVTEIIQRHGVKLGVEYRWYGRTFDGLDERFLGPIKEHAPRDYERILEYFPLAELELKRRTLGADHAEATTV